MNACTRCTYVRLPLLPSSPAIAKRTTRIDNRYSVTPTLAGDKGLNGRQMHGLHDCYAPARSVDLERNEERTSIRSSIRPSVCLSVRLFVLRDEGAVPPVHTT